MKKLLTPVAVLVFAGLFFGCASANKKAPEKAVEKVEITASSLQASAVLAPTEGNNVQGTVQFKQEENGVRIIAEVSGLTPGWHGFHVHEVGDCSSPCATSAGGHFNPHNTSHGKAGEGVHHAGDLPSLHADADGNATLNVVLDSIELSGEHSIVGRSLIVHADPDDYVSQPTGNAGARVACAVIR